MANMRYNLQVEYKEHRCIFMKNRKYLLFDLDGTIVNSAPGIFHCVKHALNSMGFEVPPMDTLKLFIGPPLRYSFTEYVGMTPEQAEEAIRLYREEYVGGGIYNSNLFDGVKEFLEKAKALGKTMLLATSKPEKSVYIVLDYLGIREYFDYISAASFTPELDSKTKIVERALLMCGCDKNDCVMIGDRIYDVEGASNNGIDCIGVLNGSEFFEELRDAGAVKIVDSFASLADYLL